MFCVNIFVHTTAMSVVTIPGLVFNPETSACDQAENVAGCEDTYVKNKRFKNEASPAASTLHHEESRSSGGGNKAAVDISSGEFSGFLALLKENGLLKPGALKALNAAMVDDASSSTFRPGLIQRDSRVNDARSLGESEERSLVVEEGDEEDEEEDGNGAHEDVTEREHLAPAKTSRLSTLFARRAQQKEAASASAAAGSATALPRLRIKVSSAATAANITANVGDEGATIKQKTKKKVGSKLLLKEEEMGKVMAAVLEESEDETMKKIVKAILGMGGQYF